MPGFDREIAKLAQRVLINPRSIDFHTGVLASKVIPGPATVLRSMPCARPPPARIYAWRRFEQAIACAMPAGNWLAGQLADSADMLNLERVITDAEP